LVIDWPIFVNEFIFWTSSSHSFVQGSRWDNDNSFQPISFSNFFSPLTNVGKTYSSKWLSVNRAVNKSLSMVHDILWSTENHIQHIFPCRDVNGVGRVRVVAPSYPTHWINICPYLYPYLSGVRYAGTSLFFFIFADINGYLQVFTKLFKKQIFNHKFK